jgi:hypothetical protein
MGVRQLADAQGLSLSLAPPLLEVLIKPGKSITQSYKIVNESDPVIVEFKIMELTENGIKNDPEFLPEKWINTINTDISLNKPFLLKNKEERQLILRINPPTGTPEKDYYRVLTVTTRPNPIAETSQSSLSQTLGSPLLITISSTGLIPKGAQIAKFQLPTIIDSFDPLMFYIDVKNTGKTYFRPVGKITLTGQFGKGTYNLSPNIILSGQTRRLTTEITSENEEPPTTLKLPGLYLGKYNLSVDFTLDESKMKLTESKTFYAVPWKGILILGIVLLGISQLLRFIQKNKK